MKKSFIGIIILGSLCIHAKEVEVATITNRNDNRTISYVRDVENGSMKFILNIDEQKIILNELSYSASTLGFDLISNHDSYRFKIFKKMTEATSNAYQWCYPGPHNSPSSPGLDLFLGGVFGALPSAALAYYLAGVTVMPYAAAAVFIPFVGVCVVGPAMPLLVGVLMAPIDGTITLGSKLFSKKSISRRKIKKVFAGKSLKSSYRTFNQLIIDIENI